MRGIVDWLENLGLSQYAQRFVENDIDLILLAELTDGDLKELGVVSLGHRRKLLRAITAMGTPAAVAGAARTATPVMLQPIAGVALPPAAIPARVESLGQRRHVTVLFCDVADSTAIAAKLDAEEWRDLVEGFREAASAAVTEMGGHVAQKLGDGLMSLFGYPLAHENDAERAARAALAIQRALAELNRSNAATGKPVLNARIGLETGPVVLNAAGEIFGDAPNIAARVQALADPGTILITAHLLHQITGLFVVEERGSHLLKGLAEPVPLFRLVRASGGGRRFRPRQLTPLVGRGTEIAMLMRRWERARNGDGQLVLVMGEPGLGKSRLIEEFHARLRDVPHTWVEWSCSQMLQNTPLHPVAEWGREPFGGADIPPARQAAELENTLVHIKLDPGENVPLLAPLLGISLPRERASTLAPEVFRSRQLAALTNWMIAKARAQPAVLALEDLQWADPTTLDLLRLIAERGAQAPLFIAATTRPEFRAPWRARPHHCAISLAPLDTDQVRRMVSELSARNALPRDVVDDVAARTGGVPLFIEEVTRLLLERGEQSGLHSIPPTLQQSLMARLDRLGREREVVQIGSVIGGGFSYGLLQALVGVEDASLQAALERLVEAGILSVHGLVPDSQYRFRHALIQATAYENLLKARRQSLHRAVAEILRDRFADTAAAEPEAVAHHFTQAGVPDAAIEWWGKAGDQALRRSAFREAMAHLRKAIEMTGSVLSSPELPAAAKAVASSQRLKLETSYGQALMWSRGFSSEESNTVFARAQQLAEGDDNVTERFDAYYGLWLGRISRGELLLARKTAETFRREAEQMAQMTEAAVACRVLGTTCFAQGDFVEAVAHFEAALRIHDPERDHDAKFRFGSDSAAVAAAYVAHAKWQFGELTRARELIEQALARAIESAHAPTLVIVQHFKVHYDILRGDAAAARRDAKTLVELSREHGIALFLAMGAVSSSWARARLGDREAVTELQQSVAAFADQGNKLWVPIYEGLLAELEAERGNVEVASTRIDQALGLAQQTGEHRYDAVLHRIHGEILLRNDPPNYARAEESLLNAIDIARQQKARSFELLGALALAKVYRRTNRHAEARATLALALEGFSPTPELPAVSDAQTLLAELAP
jgi:class 3 adenylate cyclase/tetratricopeptide (TPR) repeat protein